MTDPEPLRELIDAMPESIAIYDPDGRVEYANPATERIFGRTLAEMAGHRLWDLFPESVGNPFHRAFERVAAGGAAESFDHYYPPFDRWFDNRITRVGDRVHVVAREVTADVRRRLRLEALARMSEVLAHDELDLAGAVSAIARTVGETLGADCLLGLLSDDRAWLELVATSTIEPETRTLLDAVRRIPAEAGHPGEALRTRTVLLVQTPVVTPVGRDERVLEVLERYDPVTALVAPLFAGDEALGVLMAGRRPGGRPFTTEDRALAADLAPGVALYLAHARRRAEANTLRHRLAAVADANPAFVSFVDPTARYQYVNASYERLFGRPRAELLGRRVEDVVGPEAWLRVEPYLRQALSGAPVRFREVYELAGETRHVDGQYLPVTDLAGQVEGVAVLVVDVTDAVVLARTEAARRAEEQRATRRLESLLALTSRLAAVESADDIARVVVDEVVDAIDAQVAGLWRLDGADICLVASRGLGERAAHFARLPLASDWPVADVVRTRRPVYLSSLADYAARYPTTRPSVGHDPAVPLAIACLPLSDEGRVVGCLHFAFHDERRLTPDERTYLEVLASHTGEALRRGRLYAELRDASEIREMTISASPVGIMLLDAEGRVQAWNPAAERIYGWTAAEVVGRLLPAIAPDQQDGYLRRLRDVLAGGVITGAEARRLRKDGSWVDLELHAAPVRLSDGRSLCMSMVLDVSERKRIERGRALLAEASTALGWSLDREETLGRFVRLPVEDFADGCVIDLLDPEGRLERVAQCPEAATGSTRPFPRGSQSGTADRAVATRQPQLSRDMDASALEALATDEAYLAALRRFAPRSSLSVPMLVGDRLLGALSFVSRVRNFDDVDVEIGRELASHAAAAIDNARLYGEARAARAAAEGASQAKDQFLAMLGHELRNPLAPISTALHLMGLRAPDAVSRERAVIERQVSHLTRLVDDLLDVSRITRGKVELRRERTSLSSIVARAIELASPLLEQRRHRLTIDVPADLAVDGDPTRLAQVVCNLVSNAAKYTDAGGHVDVRAAPRQGDQVVLTVRDDGIGIAPEMLPTVFELFVQAPQGTARTQGGLGLGLAIVRSLVELHGGTVAAHSEGLGRGTELVVKLPAVTPAAEVHAESGPGVRAAPTGRRILVVDDNEDAAYLLGELLDAHGHEIRTAFDGPSALRIAEEFRPDVAVLDLGLPVMDGFELAQRLLAGRLAPRLIAVTGYGQVEDRARTSAAGFHGHLAKPVSVEALMRLVGEPT